MLRLPRAPVVGVAALLLAACGGAGAATDGKPSRAAVVSRLRAELPGSPATAAQLDCLAGVAVTYTPADQLRAYVGGALRFADLQGRPADRAAAQRASAACLPQR